MSPLSDDLQTALDNLQLEEALRLALALGDQHTTADATDKALDSYTLAARLCHELGDEGHLVESLEKLAATYLTLNRPDKAIRRIKRALNLSDPALDTARHGRLWALLGDAHQQQDKPDEAHIDYQQAAQHLQAAEDWVGAGVALGKRGMILLDGEQPVEAIVTLAQAVEMFQTARRPDLQARALGNLGAAFGKLGRWQEAGKRHNLALKLAEEAGDHDEAAYQLRNLGYVAEMDSLPDWAVIYYRRALYLSILEDNRPAIARLAVDIARLLLADEQQLPQAIMLLEVAADINAVPDTLALLDEARQRQTTLVAQGKRLTPAITDLKAYAAQA